MPVKEFCQASEGGEGNIDTQNQEEDEYWIFIGIIERKESGQLVPVMWSHIVSVEMAVDTSRMEIDQTKVGYL